MYLIEKLYSIPTLKYVSLRIADTYLHLILEDPIFFTHLIKQIPPHVNLSLYWKIRKGCPFLNEKTNEKDSFDWNPAANIRIQINTMSTNTQSKQILLQLTENHANFHGSGELCECLTFMLPFSWNRRVPDQM